ncbi:hypothetical protein F5Y06DRAFT_276094 [Hypoxylon sp. FL0890]|nr:hypothetical protein F5Y06DRAFT_276094 [Hypoxylon sp. FL0890]
MWIYIDFGDIIILAAVLICAGNALACHNGAWQLELTNNRYKTGAMLGFGMTFASIMIGVLDYLYGNVCQLLGLCLAVVASAVGVYHLWRMVWHVMWIKPVSCYSHT